MELVLIPNNTPENVLNTNIVLGEIKFDVDLIKNTVQGYLSKYEGLIIQESDIKNIKTEIAFLRKQKKLIDKNRIELSKEFDKPLVQYKEDCNSIMDIIEDTITYLDGQVKTFEEKRKEEKRKQVEDLMEKVRIFRHMPDDFDFEFEDRFLNATITLTKIKEELFEQCTQYETMKQLEKEMEEKLKAKKILLEDLIARANEQLSFEHRLRYTDYENILDTIETENLENYILKEVQDKLGTLSKECIVEEEKIKELSIDKCDVIKPELKTYSMMVFDISKEQLNKIREFFKSENMNYLIDNKENNNFNTEFDIYA